MSFRARLTIASAVAVAAAIVLASFLVYFLVSDRLHSEIDGSLRARAAQITHEKGGPFSNIPQAILGGARGFYQYVDSEGQTVLPPFEAGQQPLPVDKRVRAVAAGEKGRFYTEMTTQGVHVRMLTVPATLISAGPPTPIAVQIALPLTETDSTLSRLAWILFFVALGGVVLAVIFGWLVARAALAPVLRLTEATEEITDSRDLSRRVRGVRARRAGPARRELQHDAGRARRVAAGAAAAGLRRLARAAHAVDLAADERRAAGARRATRRRALEGAGTTSRRSSRS